METVQSQEKLQDECLKKVRDKVTNINMKRNDHERGTM